MSDGNLPKISFDLEISSPSQCCPFVAGRQHSATVTQVGAVRTMKFLRLYVRVLALLGQEARLGWTLAVAGVALASAQFIEPVLFGRIVDTLANAQGGSHKVSWLDLFPLLGAWVGFGLFIIVAGTLVALHADRLAHRHSQKVRTDYFEHVLQLPLSYHTGTHSGRLM